MTSRIRIQQQDFDLAEEYELLRQTDSAVGAVVTFSGLVRDFEVEADVGVEDVTCAKKSIDSLSLQHYPGMTEKLLEAIVEQANTRWNLIATTVIHRVGDLAPREQIVLVGVASQHRAEAFEAAQFLMDYLKTQATFWKSIRRDNQQQWIHSKASDKQAAERWSRSKDE
ncbi:Molybdenum cofactor biosynthesis protein E [marine gamma proteobacterium HTCC2207]|jgi:molybdopterin synthase catalytic subunit|uniref:Molybdopterin synthase catalytic subunit n=1 Tax=gamma proteobacterium HTCC2207 TaxID=314287 RepID=Q1YRB5_9GAMM|nr:Molybdenum cofactor biosynthesis protein E [marine gamma proteobacterium HTCC2207] [gamma proteobacterium HTCC2207]MBT5104781.1 molybdenum cofactor biosynthesis protein MoaE [Porticoccaceae bacterium]MDB4427091.1 molybdenum cofactor biosynthesis protein MoaE [Porticoccaceae bacterium]MDC0589629.1 molybdenum cofactor biosynthesis protein MoaE [Porticoccaceae bacterium]